MLRRSRARRAASTFSATCASALVVRAVRIFATLSLWCVSFIARAHSPRSGRIFVRRTATTRSIILLWVWIVENPLCCPAHSIPSSSRPTVSPPSRSSSCRLGLKYKCASITFRHGTSTRHDAKPVSVSRLRQSIAEFLPPHDNHRPVALGLIFAPLKVSCRIPNSPPPPETLVALYTPPLSG